MVDGYLKSTYSMERDLKANCQMAVLPHKYDFIQSQKLMDTTFSHFHSFAQELTLFNEGPTTPKHFSSRLSLNLKFSTVLLFILLCLALLCLLLVKNPQEQNYESTRTGITN